VALCLSRIAALTEGAVSSKVGEVLEDHFVNKEKNMPALDFENPTMNPGKPGTIQPGGGTGIEPVKIPALENK